jgi:hypothetical protein
MYSSTSCPVVGFASILSLVVATFVLIQINGVKAFYCENRIERPAFTSTKIVYHHYLNIKSNGDKSRRSIEYGQTCNRQKFWQHTQQHTKMSTKDDDVTAAQTNVIQTSTINATTTTSIDSPTNINNRSSISRTLVLAIPLMLKFALVLMIKFLTDLVVFPLLFTYRAVRIMKRRMFKVWNHWTSSTTTSDHESKEGTSLQLENFNANGSFASTDSNMGNFAPKA